MTLISHETPVEYYYDVQGYFDYDYCLVHLLDHPNEDYAEKYKAIFKQSLKYNREVFLDNSIFELGVAYEDDKFASHIEDILPSVYIVPDVLNDAEATMDRFSIFTHNYKDLPGLKMGVVQGTTLNEVIECYKFMSEFADYIAISFDSELYKSFTYGKDTVELNTNGRPQLMRTLDEYGILNKDKPHHALGCSHASEFKKYSKKYFRSVDTSNPIIAALKNEQYLAGMGYPKLVKLKDKLADYMFIELDNLNIASNHQEIVCKMISNIVIFDDIVNNTSLMSKAFRH